MKTLRNISSISLLALLSACGGGTNSSPNPHTTTGRFIDDPVQGLDYQCASGKNGTTNAQGEYQCPTGDLVSFSLAGIPLGSAMTQSKAITPYTLFPKAPLAAINLARLLQSIDTDGQADNNLIQLHPTPTLPATLDFSSTDFDAAVSVSLISAHAAQQRLNQNIVKNGGTIPANAIDILDTTAPVITLLGDNPINLYQGGEYKEPGATANDAVDGKINVSITGQVDTTKQGSYTLSYHATDKANNTATLTRTINVIVAPDTTGPATPTLLSTQLATNQATFSLQISGESGASIWLDEVQQGQIDDKGLGTLTLDTSGEDGIKAFSITLKDSSLNASGALQVNITKDTLKPSTNATLTKLQTAATSPALSGQLPSGEADKDSSNYRITLTINGQEYTATNHQDGNWSLPADAINTLSEGFYDVTITSTDAAGNQSETQLLNILEINHSGFLIDSALEGVKYTSGQYNGYTDKNGLFKYQHNQAVTFYLGDENTGIPLGSANVKADPYAARNIISIFDLAGSQDENNPQVINMGRLLQSLDSDNDVSNGILIDQRTKESIALLGLKNRINFDVSTELFAANPDIATLFIDLAGHFGEHRGLISIDDTKAHLVSVRDNTLPIRRYGLNNSRGDKKEAIILSGTFKSIQGPVEGLDYRSGNQSGRTNAQGEFHYEEGANIRFSVHELTLGDTLSKAIITPADLVPATSFDHPKPRNIIRLLAAFDAIAEDKKITIDQAVRDALETYRSQIDINLPDGKANKALGIVKGVDEFGAQFEAFELGQEILNEVSRLRAED